jgi:hypothetical protein
VASSANLSGEKIVMWDYVRNFSLPPQKNDTRSAAKVLIDVNILVSIEYCLVTGQ